MPKCKIPDCHRLAVSKGWCQMHYMRAYRHGDPLFKHGKGQCSISDCENEHVAKGYCSKHYNQFVRGLYKK